MEELSNENVLIKSGRSMHPSVNHLGASSLENKVSNSFRWDTLESNLFLSRCHEAYAFIQSGYCPSNTKIEDNPTNANDDLSLKELF